MKEHRTRILALDRGTLLAELGRAERAVDRACGGNFVSDSTDGDPPSRCDELLREYHLIEGAPEIRAGTPGEDLLSHVLIEWSTAGADRESDTQKGND